ncbi:MAG: hypothetical protein VYB30_04945 [Candidatus Thermoplasmatota archaeon]|nr:hypothetical protein [Candidatus Thermoplasmatota archaeon]
MVVEQNLPPDWPGIVHREGKTLTRVTGLPDSNSKGPSSKSSSCVFHNPAMAGSRTRSVLLMAHAIEAGMLGNSEVRALDGLSASGLRARRWLNELPEESGSRLIATVGDMDQTALDWAMATEADFPTKYGELLPLLGDLRTSVLSQGWHWIDIDPFGSPVPFLDTAIQALARRGVLEVSATDTAALSGSSKNPLMRRYGARGRLDKLKHDSGLRILMATVARAAARHDRSIEPLLSIWDSHHLRVSVRVRRVMKGANEVEESLGWRIFSPTKEEVIASISAGLLPSKDADELPIRCFLPLSHPVAREDSRVSGPMWIGPMGDSETMASMTEERVLQMCSSTYQEGDVAGWSEKDFEAERRRVVRAIRHIAEEATSISGHHLIAVDELASWQEKGSPPSPSRMVELLQEKGHCAAVSHYAEPSFRTDAPWADIVGAMKKISAADV